MVQFCYLRLYFVIDIVSRRLLQWIARIENGLKLRPTTRYMQDIQQQDKYETDSDNESDEEGDFEVVYGRTCMIRSGRSVRDHDWCVWIYEAGFILMVIRLNQICTYSINRLIGVLIAIAYPFLLLRLFSIFSVTYKLYLWLSLCEFM